MINFDHDWFRNPFAVKEILDLFGKAFNFFGSKSESEKSAGKKNDEETSASVFSKEDEAEFESLMSALFVIFPAAHALLCQLLDFLKPHQRDDLRYAVVKMRLQKYAQEKMKILKWIHTGASAKSPEKTELHMEYSVEDIEARYTDLDTRIRYLAYLAALVNLHGTAGAQKILIATRVIKEKSLAEEAKELAEKARGYLAEKWQSLDVAAAESILGSVNFQGIIQRGQALGLSDEEVWENIESRARMAVEGQLQDLRRTRNGTLSRGIRIYAGIGAAIVLVLILVIAIA